CDEHRFRCAGRAPRVEALPALDFVYDWTGRAADCRRGLADHRPAGHAMAGRPDWPGPDLRDDLGLDALAGGIPGPESGDRADLLCGAQYQAEISLHHPGSIARSCYLDHLVPW